MAFSFQFNRIVIYLQSGVMAFTWKFNCMSFSLWKDYITWVKGELEVPLSTRLFQRDSTFRMIDVRRKNMWNVKESASRSQVGAKL